MDGCFQAYQPLVSAFNLLKSLRSSSEPLAVSQGCFPRDSRPSRLESHCREMQYLPYSEMVANWRAPIGALSHSIPFSTLAARSRRSTEIDFADNQLSLSLVGLSPLSTVHPSLFLQTWVRASYVVSLTMDSSLSFGSNDTD